MCEKARQFIRNSQAAELNSRREALWQAYVFQPLPTVRFAHLHGHANEESLQAEENSRQQRLHREEMQELLANMNTQDLDSIRSWLRKAGLQGEKLESQPVFTRAGSLASPNPP
jgi:hypothetical protein